MAAAASEASLRVLERDRQASARVRQPGLLYWNDERAGASRSGPARRRDVVKKFKIVWRKTILPTWEYGYGELRGDVPGSDPTLTLSELRLLNIVLPAFIAEKPAIVEKLKVPPSRPDFSVTLFRLRQTPRRDH